MVGKQRRGQCNAAERICYSGIEQTSRKHYIPNPITERMYTFTGNYSQAQGDDIAWVRWILYDNQQDAVIQDTGEIYGTSQLRFEYDALFAGKSTGLS